MRFDVIVPSRGNSSNLSGLLKSINFQTIKPQYVYIMIDKYLSKDDFDVLSYVLLKNIDDDYKSNIIIISNINSEFEPERGVSYVRNFGIKMCSSEFIYFIDDDNVFDCDFFEKSIKHRQKLNTDMKNDVVISPTIIYRKTNFIQSRGISSFNFLFSKVVLNVSEDDYASVAMIGGNSLFGPAFVFRKIMFDERFKFVYEDLDFTYRIVNSGYPIIVIKKLGINHMERDKDRLEKSFIGDSKSIFQKSKNRILFVKKNGSYIDKIKFFGFGLWIQTLWFVLLIIFLGKNKIELLKNMIKGTYYGIVSDL